MMKNILISHIKKSAKLLGESPSEKQIKRLEAMRYDKLIQEAEYARQAIMVQVQNEVMESTRVMILEEENKRRNKKDGLYH